MLRALIMAFSDDIQNQLNLLSEVAENFVEVKAFSSGKYVLLKQNKPGEISKIIKEELKKCS